jgi:hypothetical protein
VGLKETQRIVQLLHDRLLLAGFHAALEVNCQINKKRRMRRFLFADLEDGYLTAATM